MLTETLRAGGGYRKFYSKLDAYLIRTVTFTTARIWGFAYFYDWINPDARRVAKADFYAIAAVAGGFMASLFSNPFQLVFARMQVDEMYPERARRNYGSMVEGLVKVAEEGALYRGAGAYGLKIAALCSGGGTFDWTKENMYYYFGPISFVRIVSTAVGVGTSMFLSLPFDAIATRMHTMRPLPNGQYPYKSSADCFFKMLQYECSFNKMSNYGAFYNGGQMYFFRLYAIALISQYVLDWYHLTARVTEFWAPARYQWQTGIDYDIHNPFTDGFNRASMHKFVGTDGIQATNPHCSEGKLGQKHFKVV